VVPREKKVTPRELKGIVYLDNNATTRCAPEVFEAMAPFFVEQYGNPSSAHFLGREAARAVARSREKVAETVDCDPSHVFFTSGATEANNLVLMGVAGNRSSRRQIICSAIEHRSVLAPCEFLANHGFRFSTIPVTMDGLLDVDAALSLITEDTLLVSVQGANNEVGTIQPIDQVCEIAHARGALVHCDAAQLLGKVPVSVRQLGADYVSFSGHKVHGPKGVGALVFSSAMRSHTLTPLLYGGDQENGVRPGTPNVPAIVGMGAACELARGCLAEEMSRVLSFRDLLEDSLLSLGAGIRVHGGRAPRLPGTTNVLFPGVPADTLIARAPTVCMSRGAACTSGTVSPSHVLLAMGLSFDDARSSVRISIGRYNTEGEVRQAVNSLSEVVNSILADQSPGNTGYSEVV